MKAIFVKKKKNSDPFDWICGSGAPARNTNSDPFDWICDSGAPARNTNVQIINNDVIKIKKATFKEAKKIVGGVRIDYTTVGVHGLQTIYIYGHISSISQEEE